MLSSIVCGLVINCFTHCIQGYDGLSGSEATMKDMAEEQNMI